MLRGDTIAAISSSVGPAARMIVRMSGPGARDIASTLGIPRDLLTGMPISPSPGTPGEGWGGGPSPSAHPPASTENPLPIPPPAYREREPETPRASATRLTISFDGFTFPAWIYAFHAPHSYTGDDLIELHIPGSPLLASRLLDHLLKHGARAAEPGEFTARAFFNGRMDLSTAEGVAAIIGARNEQELQAGRQLMAGELARRLIPIMASLKQTLALVEVGIDFSQEDVTILAAAEQSARIAQVDADLQSLLESSSRFARMSHEPRVVLVGRPNAGKSTLLNALAGHDRAVVSPIAGTTRDALSACIALSRGYIHLTDVGGIEEIATTDSIEQQMQSQAQRAIAEADFVILLKDATDTQLQLELPRNPDLIITSKLDLNPNVEGLAISAKSGQGMDRLIDELNSMCFASATGGGLALNVRHVRAIESARAALARTTDIADGELIAADLREALDVLGSILGHVSADDVLGAIFSGFCIGK
jgi:tRNA modification GTPase